MSSYCTLPLVDNQIPHDKLTSALAAIEGSEKASPCSALLGFVVMLHRYYYISLFVSFFDINRPLASQIFDENQILGFLYQGTEFQVLAAGLGKPQQLNEHWQSFRSQERTWSLYHFLLLFDARDDIEREKSQ